ncbi:MAG: GGDEF domain-containing protein, partial [Thermodesulfobacteriota bacterium]
AREVEAAQGLARPLSLVILDVDDFKLINDAHGHPGGDEVLRRLARLISVSARGGDFPCRYGGEEFALILPGAARKNAVDVAERIRTGFEGQVFPFEPGWDLRITVSLGVAELKPGETAAGLLDRADQALYQAKRKGKNRTVAAE